MMVLLWPHSWIFFFTTCFSLYHPYLVSVDSALGCEEINYRKHLSEHICMKWGKTYGEVMGWLRASLSFAIIRASAATGGVPWIWLMGYNLQYTYIVQKLVLILICHFCSGIMDSILCMLIIIYW